MREVAEEVGVELTGVTPIGSYFNRREHKRDTVHCFAATVSSRDHRIDEIEIAEAAWFEADALPSFRGPSVDEILKMLPGTDP
jgi:NADH pyrophosphatase NudC (nudix superfamily)